MRYFQCTVKPQFKEVTRTHEIFFLNWEDHKIAFCKIKGQVYRSHHHIMAVLKNSFTELHLCISYPLPSHQQLESISLG